MHFSKQSFTAFLAIAASILPDSAVAEDRRLKPAELEPLDSPGFISKIVGGNTAQEGDYPYYVQTDIGCGGALIHPNVIISAAHCPEPNNVIVGNIKYQDFPPGEFISEGCAIYAKHPDYNDNRSEANDLALCYLSNAVDISDDEVNVKVNLDLNIPSNGDVLRIIGMGDTSEGGSPPTDLQFADVPYVDAPTCFDSYISIGAIINESKMLCAGFVEGGVDSCQGDSGGPIFERTINQDGSETHTIVGVTSWGLGCARPNFPGVYASTSGGADWIKQTICDDWGLGDASVCSDPEPPTEPPTPVTKPSKAAKAAKAAKATKATKATKQEQECEVSVDIKVVTDFDNEETSWYLKNDASGSIVAEVNEFSSPESENQFTVEGLCSGESYTSVLEDSWKDGQVHCVFCPAQLLEVSHDRNTIFEVPDSWDGEAIESDPFTLGTDGDDCDFEIEINLVTDYFPSETFWEILQKDGSVVAGVAPGTYDDEFTAYAETVSDLCPGEYVFKLGDTHGDGQSGCSDILVLIAPQYPDGTNCPVPGMIGELSDGGDVLFDEIRYWGGDSLRATFVVP